MLLLKFEAVTTVATLIRGGVPSVQSLLQFTQLHCYTHIARTPSPPSFKMGRGERLTLPKIPRKVGMGKFLKGTRDPKKGGDSVGKGEGGML